MLKSFFKNNRAQIGETMTWLVATIVIVVMLSISVFVVISLGALNGFKFERKADLLATKSFVNYLSIDGKYDKIKETQKTPTDDLIKKIQGFYDKDYGGDVQLYVWDKHDSDVGGEAPVIGCQVDINIQLINDKYIFFCLGSK